MRNDKSRENAKYNVFIFNFNKNNSADVNLLQETWKKKKCLVKPPYNNLKKQELFEAIEEIQAYNFELFDYIVIAILCEKNKSYVDIMTSDNERVMIASDFLNKINSNKSLCHKKRLFLLQINRNSPAKEDAAILNAQNNRNTIDESEARFRSLEERCTAPGFKAYIYSIPFCHTLPERESDPFLRVFCECLESHGEKADIQLVYQEMHDQLCQIPDAGRPTIETNCSMQIFGDALSANAIKDYFPNIQTRA